jgi:branched-chain amino acid transport system permease protein
LIGPSPRFFPTLLANRPLIEVVGVQVSLLQTLTFISTLGLMAALHHLVFHTHVGTEMRAVSFDVQTAALMGIHPDLVIARTFMIGSALAAAAGIFVGLNYPRIEPTMGVMLGLKAFVAAVLGGIGNVRGAMLGGLLIGLLEAWVAGYGLSSLRDAVSFAVLILVLVARPAGLLGRAGVEKV